MGARRSWIGRLEREKGGPAQQEGPIAFLLSRPTDPIPRSTLQASRLARVSSEGLGL